MSDNEKQLFEYLALKHMDNLYTSAIRLTESAQAAEMLVQQTCAWAFNAFEQFDKNSDFGTWLHAILLRIYASFSPKYLANSDTINA